jgi:hypothetical protein
MNLGLSILKMMRLMILPQTQSSIIGLHLWRKIDKKSGETTHVLAEAERNIKNVAQDNVAIKS